ncbi:MAG: methyltransferase domain-containing protein [Terrimicrobiaceae bacterium]|nr:methyltransferase domain-containing protein [Terrimicrobiaceae bacterium]
MSAARHPEILRQQGGLFPQMRWDISALACNEAVRSRRFGIPAEAKGVRYPVRLLRYWFGYHLLREEAVRLGRGIEVAEVGVHSGQMFEFYRSMPGAPPVARWTAFDAVVLRDKLRKAGYTEMVEVNVEDPAFSMGGPYDAALALHILEHLHHPEAALGRIAQGLRVGGVVIGGFPVLPDWLRTAREARLRRTAAPMGHVSVFSPRRVREMARACGMAAEFLAGAYFLRSKGLALENLAWWMRFNLLWGALFPWWPGEIYWRFRKC